MPTYAMLSRETLARRGGGVSDWATEPAGQTKQLATENTEA